MRLFYFIFYICLIIHIMIFRNNGCIASNYLKSYCINDYSFISKKIQRRISINLLWTDIIGCGSCGYYMNLYPVCNKSDVFVSDRHGMIKKLNLYTGKCVWSKKLSDLITCQGSIFISNGLSLNKGSLYVGSEVGKIYALDIVRGDVLWVSQVFGEVISTPVVSQGLVFVYTSNGIFYALHERDGRVKWTVNFDIPAFSFLVTVLPAIASDIVIIGDSSGVVSACDVQTGQLIWQKKIFNVKGITDIDRLSDIIAPIVINNIVYAVAYNGNIVALDLTSGSVIWSKDIGSLINIIVKDSCIYLIDQYNRIIALNSSDGSIIWSKSDWMYCQLTSIASYKDYVLFGDSKGYLYWLHKKDGCFLGKKKICMTYFNKLLVFFDKIIIYEKNGKISIWHLINIDF